MGGAAVQQLQLQHQLFPVGSLVEVKTDEEGFKGVFFVATVIPSCPLSKSKKGRKSFKKLHVEYHNLVASEDGSDRLREIVDVSFVRPAPPPQEDFEGFGLNDSVDAFYKDGWWTGIIAQVLEGGRFVVTFPNPPDEIEFGLSELRVHWDWCNGTWFRPERQGITSLMFEVGRKVEVSFEVEEFLGAWFPATIRKILANGTYLVEYHSSNISNEDQFLRATVDSLHVRPCPPFLKDKNYVLLEKVNCFFNYGWWNGVITKVFEDCRYVVFLKQTNKEKEFDQSELRPHMDWKDSKWFTSSFQLCEDLPLRSSEDERFSPHASENTGDTTMAVVSVLGNNDCDKRTSCLLNSRENLIEPLIGSNEKSSHEKLSHQSCQNASGISAVAASNPGNNDDFDQRTRCLLDLGENQIQHLVLNNIKSLHPAKLRSKRRWHLSGAYKTHLRPIKKLKEGNIPEVCEQVASDMLAEETLCSSNSKIDGTVLTTEPTTIDQSSENLSSMELRKPQNIWRKDYSISRNSKKSRTPTLQLESSESDRGARTLGINFAGMEQDAVGNAAEGGLNELAEKETELPIIIGLPCAETNSSGLGKSRGKSGGHLSSSKKILRLGSDKIRYSDAIEDTKNSKQTEFGEFSQKRKRGRPRKELINNPHVLGTGYAKNGNVASSYIGRKDGDSHGDNEVVMTDNNLTFNHFNDGLIDGPDPKNSNKNTKTTLSEVHKQAMEESTRLPKSPSKSGDRHKVEGKTKESNCLTGALEKVVNEIPCSVSDEQLSKLIEGKRTPTNKDSESNSLIETHEKIIDEVSCYELDEPLSKWIEEMQTPTIKDSANSIDQSLGKTIESNCLTEALEKVVDEVPFDELDEPLSKWIETVKGPGVLPVSHVKECVQNIDNAMFIDGNEKQKTSGVQPCAFDATCATVPSEPENLPFAKTAVLWNTIDTMDIFQRRPQRPHFQPLIHLRESSREGLAIGYMVTFSRVVEKASRLQINDPESIMDEILETLEDLEKYGFDVKVVADYVSQMLEVKHRQEDLREEAKGIDSQLGHHNLEKQKIDEEIREMRRRILMLQEKILVAASAQEKEGSKIAPLQSKLQKIEEDIKIMELEFQNLAASL